MIHDYNELLVSMGATNWEELNRIMRKDRLRIDRYTLSIDITPILEYDDNPSIIDTQRTLVYPFTREKLFETIAEVNRAINEWRFAHNG